MVVERKLLLRCVLDPCGHDFQCWSEVDADGSWSIHFHAPCAEGEALARKIAATVAHGVPVVRGD